MKITLLGSMVVLSIVGTVFLIGNPGSAGTDEQDPEALVGVTDAGATATARGCGPVEDRLFQDEVVTLQTMLTGRAGGPGLPTLGEATTVSEAREKGFEALTPTDTKGRAEIVRRIHPPSLVTYLDREPITSSTTFEDLMTAGGAIIVESPTEEGPTIVERVKANVGARAVAVRIGPYDGLIVHGDEIDPRCPLLWVVVERRQVGLEHHRSLRRRAQRHRARPLHGLRLRDGWLAGGRTLGRTSPTRTVASQVQSAHVSAESPPEEHDLRRIQAWVGLVAAWQSRGGM